MEKVLVTKYGNLSISQDAISDLVRLAVKEVKGVALIQDNPSQVLNFLKKDSQEMVSFDSDSDALNLTLNVTVLNGFNIGELAVKIQEKVKSALETMLEIKVKDVNIKIVGIKHD
ncbi:MAG: Asp23/Gls24 family envelope stress response protein [Tissierellia bacterium]|nr:Asp23/Gls24 family envelope stress response protein [Tissierellia bacterium]